MQWSQAHARVLAAKQDALRFAVAK